MHAPTARLHRPRRALIALGLGVPLIAALPGVAIAHDKGLDHPAPSFAEDPLPLGTGLNSGGEGADWELITSIPTGNPHTDIDFFTQGGETYAAVGTLAAGGNGGGQSIVKLTEGGEVDPMFVTGHPSAACASNPEAVLGLQHDVEATPKSADVTNGSYDPPVSDDAQLIIDATDAEGRCHDQGVAGIIDAPRGGLEIVDITDIENPVEIGLTSHIGESHTVNIDPKRPHIAYSVTSDSVGVTTDDNDTPDDPSDDTFTRTNEASGLALDGFEVVDLSSCLAPPYGTMELAPGLEGQALIDAKREACAPETYRYRYESVDMALGHTLENTIYGCHELEVYPDDTLACAGGAALIMLDMAGAFEEDPETGLDKPKGTALPCVRRDSTSTLTPSGAKVMDCVNGPDGPQSLSVANYPEGNASLEGVEWLGTAYHAGRASATGAATDAPPVTEDIDFNHEAELTRSGDFVLATDERGGGVTVGAQCDIGNVNSQGNGGIHAYQVDELKTERPVATTDEAEADLAYESYARGTDGEKAVFRAPLRTGAVEGTFCTSHVMQQIPDQNRIFMGYYTQGTQVVDYVELPDGRLEWVEDQGAQEAGEDVPAQAETGQAGFFIPEKANTWVSHVFKTEANDDGTFTYYGATGDFQLGGSGRNAIDVYKVTLPGPATACTLAPESAVTDREGADEVHRRSVDCVLHYAISRGQAGGTTYGPNADVTRGQMASFVLNAINAAGSGPLLPAASGADRFNDLAKDPTHRASINKLAELGIIRGTGGGAFDPLGKVSRAQMATFVTNAARFLTGEPITASRDSFSDEDPTHGANINAGFERGYFRGTTAPTGTAQGSFTPFALVQRDQMASFLSNLFTRTITQDALTARAPLPRS